MAYGFKLMNVFLIPRPETEELVELILAETQRQSLRFLILNWEWCYCSVPERELSSLASDVPVTCQWML